MPQEGILGYLKWRVLDQNTGAVVISDLPHLHQSSYTVRGLQKGFPGSVQIGDFRIPLPAPYSEDHRRARYLYDLLAAGQRIEGFLGDVITGTPRFSGVITKITKNLKDPWLIEGVDSLWWLQQSQTLPGELAQQTRGSGIVGSYLGTQELVWSDNFPTSTSFQLNYTNTGFAQNASDPYFGLSNIQVSGTTVSTATAVSTWGQAAQFLNGVVSLRGTVVAGTAAGSAANFGIALVSDATFQNGIYVNVQMDSTAGAAPYSAHLTIFSQSAGTFTQQAQVLNVFTGLNATFQFELQAVLSTNVTTLNASVRAILNGKDPGVVWNPASLTVAGGVTPGRIGVRHQPAAGGTPALYVNNLQFESRTSSISSVSPFYTTAFGTNRFAVGNITISSANNVLQNVNLAGQSQLDAMLLASMVDGFFIRKNPGFGFKADSIDYAAQPGTDLSSSIVFDEGSNVVNAFIGPVPDMYATNAKFNAVRGFDSGGLVTWPRFGSVGDMVLTDTAQDVGVPGFRWMMNYALQVQARKASPNAAQTIEVYRTADTADKWRELDFVTVNVPTLGINKQRSLVLGYTFAEGSPTQMLYLAQFSAVALPRAAPLVTAAAMEWLSTIYANR